MKQFQQTLKQKKKLKIDELKKENQNLLRPQNALMFHKIETNLLSRSTHVEERNKWLQPEERSKLTVSVTKTMIKSSQRIKSLTKLVSQKPKKSISKSDQQIEQYLKKILLSNSNSDSLVKSSLVELITHQIQAQQKLRIQILGFMKNNKKNLTYSSNQQLLPSLKLCKSNKTVDIQHFQIHSTVNIFVLPPRLTNNEKSLIQMTMFQVQNNRKEFKQEILSLEDVKKRIKEANRQLQQIENKIQVAKSQQEIYKSKLAQIYQVPLAQMKQQLKVNFSRFKLSEQKLFQMIKQKSLDQLQSKLNEVSTQQTQIIEQFKKIPGVSASLCIKQVNNIAQSISSIYTASTFIRKFEYQLLEYLQLRQWKKNQMKQINKRIAMNCAKVKAKFEEIYKKMNYEGFTFLKDENTGYQSRGQDPKSFKYIEQIKKSQKSIRIQTISKSIKSITKIYEKKSQKVLKQVKKPKFAISRKDSSSSYLISELHNIFASTFELYQSALIFE